ncbi:hypothetical protein I3247_04795 [Psychrobacter sp. Ps5]|nr:hypothetical protein [Psychrobacter sp. Ps5]MCG3860918.1 hypothetical protein [Psychrobacter sp. Ps5]
MKDVVITAGTAVGSVLALAEAITTKTGCKAYVLCTDKKASKILASSRFIDDVVFIPMGSEQEYIAEIQRWYKKAQFKENPILYFTTDTTCFYIDNHRAWFENNFNLCLPSSEIVQQFTQKGLAEIKAVEAGLMVPKTKVIVNSDDIESILISFKFPVILKPRATYLKQGLDFKIKVIHNKNDFTLFVNKHVKNKNTLLCQEFIPGSDDTSYYYLFYRSKGGNIFENMGRKTLQSTSEGGIMLKGISEFNQDLSCICKDFLNNINYQGIGGIEFKKHSDQFYFIEMSVRLEGFFKLSEIAKTPLGLISYYDIAEENIPSNINKSKQKDGYIYIDYVSTLVNHIKNRALIHVITDSLNIMFNPKVKLNVFSIRDYKPFGLQVSNLFGRK